MSLKYKTKNKKKQGNYGSCRDLPNIGSSTTQALGGMIKTAGAIVKLKPPPTLPIVKKVTEDP